MLSPITAVLIGVATLCMFLACIDWSPVKKEHHSQFQKRSRGKFVTKHRSIQRKTVKFDYISNRKLRRV